MQTLRAKQSHYSCQKGKYYLPPSLPGENSGTHLSNLRSFSVLQSNPGQIISEQNWNDRTLPRPPWGILQSAKHLKCTKALSTPWHSSPAWIIFFMVAIFAFLLRAEIKEDINRATLDTTFYNAVCCSAWFLSEIHWRTWGLRYSQNHLENV